MLMAGGAAPPCGLHRETGTGQPPVRHWFPAWAMWFPLPPEDSLGDHGFPRAHARPGAVPGGCSRVTMSPTHRAMLGVPSTHWPIAWGGWSTGPSWDGSWWGHELGIPHTFPPSPKGHYFCPKKKKKKRVLHICSAAAGQESHSGPGRGDESSSGSPGTSAPSCLQPSLPLPAP